jgi:hypothetical protein
MLRLYHFLLTHKPWHRWFLWQFENMLRNQSAEYECVTVPYVLNLGVIFKLIYLYRYWQTESTALLGTSYLLRPESFGSRVSGCVPNGFMQNWTYDSSCVRRTYPGVSICSEACTQRVIATYTTYGTDNGFRANYEATPHSSPHNWLGGTMNGLGSAIDVLFFLHHRYAFFLFFYAPQDSGKARVLFRFAKRAGASKSAPLPQKLTPISNVDRMWAIWQDCHNHDTVPYSSLKSVQVFPFSI